MDYSDKIVTNDNFPGSTSIQRSVHFSEALTLFDNVRVEDQRERSSPDTYRHF